MEVSERVCCVRTIERSFVSFAGDSLHVWKTVDGLPLSAVKLFRNHRLLWQPTHDTNLLCTALPLVVLISPCLAQKQEKNCCTQPSSIAIRMNFEISDERRTELL